MWSSLFFLQQIAWTPILVKNIPYQLPLKLAPCLDALFGCLPATTDISHSRADQIWTPGWMICMLVLMWQLIGRTASLGGNACLAWPVNPWDCHVFSHVLCWGLKNGWIWSLSIYIIYIYHIYIYISYIYIDINYIYIYIFDNIYIYVIMWYIYMICIYIWYVYIYIYIYIWYIYMIYVYIYIYIWYIYIYDICIYIFILDIYIERYFSTYICVCIIMRSIQGS